jgi:DNA-binding response OmpR family regulator
MRELVLRLNNIISHQSSATTVKIPRGLDLINDEFYITDVTPAHIFALSGEEKKLLQGLISPIGGTVPASPMVAKRLRSKLNIVLSHLDIITVRGHGYKLIDISANKINKETI